MSNTKSDTEAGAHDGDSSQASCSTDRRSPMEKAAAEIVMTFVGFPSLMCHEKAMEILRKHLES